MQVDARLSALLLLYYCFTTALLLLYLQVTYQIQVDARLSALLLLLLLLLPLLYYCFTTAVLQDLIGAA
jgi:hypothetical protein